MPFRRIAPTVAPLPSSTLFRGFRSVVAGRSAPGASLAEAVKLLFPGHRVVTFNSGRAALARAIGAALKATGRTRVVLPAYTSFSVAAAAKAAGALVDLCDLDPSTLQLDRESLRRCIDHRTAAVVLGNLYGFPDVTADLDWVVREGVWLIDDAAQALGALEGSRPVGSRGRVGVLSFGRGKCVALGDAGAIAMNPDGAGDVADPSGSARRGIGPWILASVASRCTDQLLFGLLSRLPGGHIGESHYEPDFTVEAVPVSVDAMAWGLDTEVRRQLDARTRVAAGWGAGLAGVGGLMLPQPAAGTRAAYLRFPVLVTDSGRREAVIARLAEARFGYVQSYPGTLASIDRFRDICAPRPTPGADEIAARVVALPCHMGVREADIARAVRSLQRDAVPSLPGSIGSYRTNYVTR